MRQSDERLNQILDRHPTVPIDRTHGEQRLSSYGSFTYRTVGAMLLSGRIIATKKRAPRRADVNRICKSARFDPGVVERAARFLIAGDVLSVDQCQRFVRGRNHQTFWNADAEAVRTIARYAFVEAVSRDSGSSSLARSLGNDLIEVLSLFFSALTDRTFPSAELGAALEEAARLPRSEVQAAAECLMPDGEENISLWTLWFGAAYWKTVIDALIDFEWIHVCGADDAFIAPTLLGLEMLGVRPLTPLPSYSDALTAGQDRSAFAGAGMSIELLAELFARCKVRSFGPSIEFNVDRHSLVDIVATFLNQKARGRLCTETLRSAISAMLDCDTPTPLRLEAWTIRATVEMPTCDVVELKPSRTSPPGLVAVRRSADSTPRQRDAHSKP